MPCGRAARRPLRSFSDVEPDDVLALKHLDDGKLDVLDGVWTREKDTSLSHSAGLGDAGRRQTRARAGHQRAQCLGGEGDVGASGAARVGELHGYIVVGRRIPGVGHLGRQGEARPVVQHGELRQVVLHAHLARTVERAREVCPRVHKYLIVPLPRRVRSSHARVEVLRRDAIHEGAACLDVLFEDAVSKLRPLLAANRHRVVASEGIGGGHPIHEEVGKIARVVNGSLGERIIVETDAQVWWTVRAERVWIAHEQGCVLERAVEREQDLVLAVFVCKWHAGDRRGWRRWREWQWLGRRRRDRVWHKVGDDVSRAAP